MGELFDTISFKSGTWCHGLSVKFTDEERVTLVASIVHVVLRVLCSRVCEGRGSIVHVALVLHGRVCGDDLFSTAQGRRSRRTSSNIPRTLSSDAFRSALYGVVPRVRKDIVEGVYLMAQECTQQRTAEKIVVVPVGQIRVQIVPTDEVIPQKRISGRIVEQIMHGLSRF